MTGFEAGRGALSPLEQELHLGIVAADSHYGRSYLGSPYVGLAALRAGGADGFRALAEMEPSPELLDELHESAVDLHKFFRVPLPDGFRTRIAEITWPIMQAGGVATIAAAATATRPDPEVGLRLLTPEDESFNHTVEFLNTGGYRIVLDLVRTTSNLLADPRYELLRHNYRKALGAGIATPGDFPDVEADALRKRMTGHVKNALETGFPEYAYHLGNQRIEAVIGTLMVGKLADGLVPPRPA